jgi:hypothetical protein
VLGALAQDFRREHAVDLEKLELDRVAARIRRRIHKGTGAIQVAAMVAGSLCDKNRVSIHLTKSKDAMAKKRLTGWNLRHGSRRIAFGIFAGRQT